jgi:hypothetical protein
MYDNADVVLSPEGKRDAVKLILIAFLMLED